MAIKTFAGLAADPNTVITELANGDLFLVYRASEPIDSRKVKVITKANVFAGAISLQGTIGDGVNVITTTPSIRGHIYIPVACDITGWTIIENQGIEGSIVLDVWKETYANYPPTNSDSIAGTEKPTLNNQIKNQDLTLTTWTIACAAGDLLAYEVEGATDCKQVTLILHAVKL